MDNIKKDLIIIGGGPAGLTSAIYASRAGIDTLVIDNYIAGGQVATSDIIENYPGFLKISGAELSEIITQQARKNGAEVKQLENLESVYLSNDKKEIKTSENTYTSRCVIIASGANPVPLPVENEEEFRGRGIHYCAVCDGALYKGKNVAVVGGGNSAVDEAYFLSNLAQEVTIILRKDKFKAEKRLIDRITQKSNINIMYNTEVVAVEGKDSVDTIIIRDTLTANENKMNFDGLFVYIGSKPNSDMFKEYITTDERGYIPTNEKMMTNISGVYAVGDIRVKDYRQLTTAVSDGTIAALEVERYLAE
jgi:thioredoxin reductase (NADPH)